MALRVKKLFEGTLRKLAIGTIVLTLVGWLLVVIGFGIGTTIEEAPRTGAGNTYHFWAVIVVGPLAVVSALLSAAFPQPVSGVLGSITAFIGVFFTTSLGITLFVIGSRMNANTISGDYEYIEFAGALTALVFWTATLMLASVYNMELADKD